MCSKETFRDQFTNGTVEIYKKVTIYFYDKYSFLYTFPVSAFKQMWPNSCCLNVIF